MMQPNGVEHPNPLGTYIKKCNSAENMNVFYNKQSNCKFKENCNAKTEFYKATSNHKELIPYALLKQMSWLPEMSNV